MKEQKMREEFEAWWEEMFFTKNGFFPASGPNDDVVEGFLIDKRQDAERIAELERKLASAEFLNKMRHKPYADTDAGLVAQIDELRAKLEALEKQEPVCHYRATGQIDFTGHGPMLLRGSPLYAKPMPATPATPEGWQLVPKEPTEEMAQAFWDRYSEKAATCSGMYSAMLAVVPNPPSHHRKPLPCGARNETE